MSVLAKHGFSTAIFGGAWSHEHFTTIQVDAQISIAEAVKYSMWEGKSLPTELGCDCLKGRPHHTSEYTSNPIVASACEMPAGSLLFFETDFQGAFVHPRGLDSKVCFRKPQTISKSCMPMLMSETSIFYCLLLDLNL